MECGIELGGLYRVSLPDRGVCVVRAVDGECWFKELSLSHGFIHFADPVTGAKVGFSGISWFAAHAERVDNKESAE